MRVIMAIAVFLGLLGCVDAPELGGGVPERLKSAPYPGLLPLDQVLGHAPDVAVGTQDIQARLDARVARLRARAATLRGPVLDARARERLRQDVVLP